MRRIAVRMSVAAFLLVFTSAQLPPLCGATTSQAFNQLSDTCPTGQGKACITQSGLNLTGGTTQCTMSCVLTLQGSCTNNTVSGWWENWSLRGHSDNQAIADLNSILNQNPPPLGPTPPTSSPSDTWTCNGTDILKSKLWEGAISTGTLRLDYRAIYACLAE